MVYFPAALVRRPVMHIPPPPGLSWGGCGVPEPPCQVTCPRTANQAVSTGTAVFILGARRVQTTALTTPLRPYPPALLHRFPQAKKGLLLKSIQRLQYSATPS